MPKIIPELKSNILSHAQTVFVSQGYDGLSMRQLAAELNIAVGTLYNYFPNKVTLFLSLFEESWNESYSAISAIVNDPDLKRDEKIKETLAIIYGDVKNRGAMAFSILDSSKGFSLRDHKAVKTVQIIEELHTRMKPLGGLFSEPDSKRMLMTILSAIRGFTSAENQSDEREDRDFLFQLIRNFEEN